MVAIAQRPPSADALVRRRDGGRARRLRRAVYTFVSRNASETLNEQMRTDFTWVYASLYQDDDGECDAERARAARSAECRFRGCRSGAATDR